MYIEGFWSRNHCGNLIQNLQVHVHSATFTTVKYWHKWQRVFDTFQNPLDSLVIPRTTCSTAKHIVNVDLGREQKPYCRTTSAQGMCSTDIS